MQGKPFIRNGITLISGIDPLRRAERTADAVCITAKTLYFCPSPLYGYGLERFLSRLEKEANDCAVLCVEADSELFELTCNNISAVLRQNNKLRITNISDAAGLSRFVHDVWGSNAFRRLEILRFTGGWQLHSKVYDFLCDTLRREIAVDWSNTLTLTKLGRLYIRNMLRNLKCAAHLRSVSELSFGSSPVLVLGAGPSLDQTLDAIIKEQRIKGNEQKRSFRIICVDTCLRALKDRGIVPDLVVILESQHWNIPDFLGCREWDVPFAIDLSASPVSASFLGGQGYLFFTPWTRLSIFERLKEAKLLPASIPPLGSVGLTAAFLARKLTTGKIICSGLDFSFTFDNCHARGTPAHSFRLNSQTRFRGVFNKNVFDTASVAAVSKSGGSVLTNPAMKHYRNIFEQEFSGELDDNRRIFDIESSGLPLGIKTLSIEEAVSVLKDTSQNFHKEISEVCGGYGKERDIKPSAQIANFLKGEKERLEELKKILTGEAPPDQKRLPSLIRECDYLWAHFPDCAGGRHPVLEDGSHLAVVFLKRLRMEIDPMLRSIN